MFNHWNDIERTWAAMEALRRGMDEALAGPTRAEVPGRPPFWAAAGTRGPAIDVFETEDGYLITADLPGFDKKDLELKFEDDRLTITAKRSPKTPEGYQVVMEERGALAFSKSLGFPAKVDAERIEAKLQNGVLELRVPKHADAKPRQIPINLG